MSNVAVDVTDAEFQASVIDRSHELPVLVDLWAPWCGPCRQLTPILERVAKRRAGEFLLVKINVDENPQVAGAMGARSIPLVVGFRDGEIVGRFMGLQPESAVMAFINKLVPSEADRLVASAQSAATESERERLLRHALSIDPRHSGAGLGLATLLGDSDRIPEALETLARFPTNGADEIATARAALQLKAAADTDVSSLEAQLADNPDDYAAMIAIGKALGAKGDFEGALKLLLDAVRGDPTFDDGAARAAMLDLLKVMGQTNPLTREYRSKLATLLF